MIQAIPTILAKEIIQTETLAFTPASDTWATIVGWSDWTAIIGAGAEEIIQPSTRR